MLTATTHLVTAAVPAKTRVALRRRRRIFAAGVLLAPGLFSLASDVLHRGRRIAAFDVYHGATYLGAVIESLVIGSLLLAGAARRRGSWRWALACLFAIELTAAIGGQHYFFEQYNAYLNTDVSEFASNFKDSIVNQLLADLSNYLKVLLPVLVLAIGLLAIAKRWVRLTRRQANIASVLAPALLLA